MNAAARGVLAAHDFVEIETPTLTRSTPEGARDFLVPARLQPGSFYALPQSPQLFKQLLMVAGMERYYQIARCYRDEDFRADRQPEFTQLDMEMSFVDADDVIAVSEEVLQALWALIGYDLPLPLPRISYADAMRRFGSDKPDLRFGLELVECTEYFSDTPFRVFQAPYVGAVVMPGGASQPRRTLDGWQEFAKQRGHKGLAYVLVAEDGTLGGPVAKNLTDAERDGLAAHVGAKPGDCVFFAAGSAKAARALLGATRIEIAKRLDMIDPDAWAFTWVVDWPLFEAADEATASGDVAVGSGAWTAVHHAFTSPKPESEATFDTDPGSALANAYDIVCNGNEIGGGSIRIHRRDVQERVFAMMGIDHDEAQDKFGFLLDAFTFGAPPHGGIAFGWDRITALLAGDGLDPRGHRVPEVRRRRRPADRCARADHRAAAQGVGNRRQTRRRTGERRSRAEPIPGNRSPTGSSLAADDRDIRLNDFNARHRRRVPRQRGQGGRSLRGRHPAAAAHHRGQVRQAAAVAAGLPDDRRQDDHHGLLCRWARRIRPGCTTCGPTRARTSRSVPTPMTSPCASCRSTSATRRGRRSPRWRRRSPSTSRTPAASSRCSS